MGFTWSRAPVLTRALGGPAAFFIALCGGYLCPVGAQDQAAAYVNRSAAYFRLGQLDKVVSDLNASIDADPKHSQSYYLRGLVEAGRAQFAQAAIDFTEALRLNPRSASIYSARASAYLNQSDLEQAAKDAAAALRLNPKDVTALTVRANIYHNKGQYASAIKELRQALD